jgi:hypothetical protein
MSIITDPVLINKMAMWRAKAADKTITLDDMKEAIIAMRGNRKAAVEASAAGRATKKKSPPSDKSVDDMLSELEGL